MKRMPGLAARLGTSVALSAAALVLLAACASSAPSDQERAAWAQWGSDAIAANGVGVGGVFATDASSEGVTETYPSPQALHAVELRCIGTDRAQFTLSYTGTGESTTVTQDIVCHDGGLLTPIAIPTAVGELTAFTADATSPDGEGYWVALPQG